MYMEDALCFRLGGCLTDNVCKN